MLYIISCRNTTGHEDSTLYQISVWIFTFYNNKHSRICQVAENHFHNCLQRISREVFCHEYDKIPRHTGQNPITEGDLEWILTKLLWTEWTVTCASNCESCWNQLSEFDERIFFTKPYVTPIIRLTRSHLVFLTVRSDGLIPFSI